MPQWPVGRHETIPTESEINFFQAKTLRIN